MNFGVFGVLDWAIPELNSAEIMKIAKVLTHTCSRGFFPPRKKGDLWDMLTGKVDKNYTRKEEAEEKDLITVIIVASIKWSHFSLKNKMYVYWLNISTHDSVFFKKRLSQRNIDLWQQ